MEILELCEKIGMPREVTEQVLSHTAFDRQLLVGLTHRETAADTYRALKSRCQNGMELLACSLQAARLTYEAYRALGIDERVFIDTMKCFSRFIGETYTNCGVYDFDRGWWTYRQLSLSLFRLGELEYEYLDSEQKVSIHIPSDADISLDLCRESYARYLEFTERFFPDKAGYTPVCESWLLSPTLKELLPPSSRIRAFASCFRVTAWNREASDYLTWIYGKPTADYATLPENTSLQRSVKQVLLNGGAIGSAYGELTGF